MSPRKILKKQIAKLKQLRTEMYIEIDCGQVLGGSRYSQNSIDMINKDISDLEEQLRKIPIPIQPSSPSPAQN